MAEKDGPDPFDYPDVGEYEDDPDYYNDYVDYDEPQEGGLLDMIVDPNVDLKWCNLPDSDSPYLQERVVDLFNEQELGSLTARLSVVADMLPKLPNVNNSTFGGAYPNEKRVNIQFNGPCYGSGYRLNDPFKKRSPNHIIPDILFVRSPTGDNLAYGNNNSLTLAGGLKNWRANKAVRAYHKWFLNDSPWAKYLFDPMRAIPLKRGEGARLRKRIWSVDFVIENGLILYGINGDIPAPIINTALCAHRFTWERPWWCDTWYKLTKIGVNPNVAQWMTHCVFQNGGLNSYCAAPVTTQFNMGHGFLGCGAVNRKTLKGVFEGTFSETFNATRKLRNVGFHMSGNCTGAFGEELVDMGRYRTTQARPPWEIYLPRFGMNDVGNHLTVWPTFLEFFGPYLDATRSGSYKFGDPFTDTLFGNIVDHRILAEIGKRTNEFAEAVIS